MPLEGSTTITDAVQGDVTVSHDTLDDLVMLRGDGTPTYMLAVVVDDHDMGVSHVIRGDDHLNNAFRQQKIIEAMDWPVPQYAHIPLIHGADGAKLSKRHGALSATAYRDMGFLPEAMCNYLLRLGWSHGDDEIISRQQAIEWFDLSGIGKAAARFDLDKLTALNSQYIGALPADDLIALMLNGAEAEEHIMRRLERLAPAFAERASLTHELPAMAGFALSDDAPSLDDDAAAMMDDTAKARLAALATALPDSADDYNAFKAWLAGWLEGEGLKMRDIGPILRIALTGTKQAPDIILIATALGAEEMRQRIATICK